MAETFDRTATGGLQIVMGDLKKIDKAALFLSRNADLFQCPICKSSFPELNKYSLICENNHSFDLSKKGTLYFLMNASKNEYGKTMLQERRKVSENNLFDSLLGEIYKKIKNKNGNTLDVGCGEGSHLSYLSEEGLEGNKIGFDISKEGIQLAASRNEDLFWCVADLSRSPFASTKYDTILNIFSPSNYLEFQRLLKPGGQVIKVVPETGYLHEMREILYKNKKEKQTYSNSDVLRLFAKHFPEYQSERVTYTKKVDETWREALIRMTPLSWGAGVAELNSLKIKELDEITIDVLILTGNMNKS